MANFKNITVKGLEKDEALDLRKTLGNHLYYNSKDLTGNELGRKIYFSDGNVELTDEEKALVMSAVETVWGTYVIRIAVENELKK